MKKLKVLLLILVVIIASGFIFQKQLTTHLKIALFITEEFPQIPIKPLPLITTKPIHQKVELNSSNGKIVADLYIPNQILRLPSVAQDKAAALILAMGVRTQEKDKPLLFHFADTMARLGYVVFWPRLELLDRGESLPEEPETFIESFKYLESLPQVDPHRISFIGFSVGSSTAMVASSDPQIQYQVHGLVFFGGYFDVFDYLDSLATENLSADAKDHTKALLKNKGLTENLKILEGIEATPSADEVDILKKISPKHHLNQFKAKIFILHDKSDTYVPYMESVKLYQAIPNKQVEAYLISDLFEHVQPNRPLNWGNIGELFKLYGFLYQTLSFL